MALWNTKFALAAALTTSAFASNCFAQIPVNMERTPVVETSEPAVPEAKVVQPEVVPSEPEVVSDTSRFDQLQVIPSVNPFNLETPLAIPVTETNAPEPNLTEPVAPASSPNNEATQVANQGVVPVVPSPSIAEPDATPVATRATFSDVEIVNSPATIASPLSAPMSTSAPALILRPTESNRQMMNDCVVEVSPRPNAQAGYQLRIAVPDSVSAIEVVPSGNTQRQFRIQLDENAADEQVVNSSPNLTHPPQSPEASADADVSKTAIKTSADRSDAERMIDDSVAQQSMSVEDSGPYQINPFYQQRYASSRVVARAKHSDKQSDKQVELTNAQLDVGQRTPSQLETETRTQNVPTLDIPFEEIGAQKIDATGTAGDELAGLEIVDELRDPLAQIAVEPFGPATMTNGNEADFTVVLRNQSDLDVQPFDLRLSLPEGMQVTVLDRPADFDAEYQTITWSIDGLRAEQTLSIRYRVKSLISGRHTQAMETGRNGVYGNLTTFSTSASAATKR